MNRPPIRGCSIWFACIWLGCFALPVRTAEPIPPLPSIEGTWRWNFTMPDGSTVRPRLKLRLRNGVLSGATSYRAESDASVTNLALSGQDLRFQVVRTREARSIVTTYIGRWTNDTIVGRIESDWAGEPKSYPWQAERTSIGLDGTWKWSGVLQRGSSRSRTNEVRAELEQHGSKLSGRTVGRIGGGIPLRHGTVTNSMIAFDIERTLGELKIVSHFEGRFSGDTIRGKVSIDRDRDGEVDDEEEEFDWEAHRVD